MLQAASQIQDSSDLSLALVIIPRWLLVCENTGKPHPHPIAVSEQQAEAAFRPPQAQKYGGG
jgi:hypothetical protein